MTPKRLLHIIFDDGEKMSKLLVTDKKFEDIISLLSKQENFKHVKRVYLINMEYPKINSFRWEEGEIDGIWPELNEPDGDFVEISRVIDEMYRNDLKIFSSKSVFRKLMVLTKKNDDLRQMMSSMSSGFQKGMDTAFHQISLQTLQNMILDSPAVKIVVVNNDRVYALLERQTSEDDESFYANLGLIYGPKLKPKQLLKEMSKHKDIEIFAIDELELYVQKSKVKYRDYNVEHDYTRKAERRNEEALRIMYLKALNASFSVDPNIDPLNQKQVLSHFEEMVRSLHSALLDRGLVYKLDSLKLDILDFEYDETRKLMYLDFRVYYSVTLEDGTKITDKYATFMTNTGRLSTDNKSDILNCTLLKTLSYFANAMSRCFVDNNTMMHLSNCATNGFTTELIDRYFTENKRYTVYIKR